MKSKLFILVPLLTAFCNLPFALAADSVSLSPMAQNLSQSGFGSEQRQNDELVPQMGKAFTWGSDAEGMQLPYLMEAPKSILYPRWAVRKGMQGRVDVAIEILKDGSVGKTDIMKSSGHAIFDKTAQDAIKTWKFHPAVKDGKPVHTCIQVPVSFSLKD